MTAGARFAEVRHARGLTQPQLAEAVGKTVATIQNYEHDRSHPTLPVLQRLAAALAVSTATLLKPVGAPIPAGRNHAIKKIADRINRGGGCGCGYTVIPFLMMLCHRQ